MEAEVRGVEGLLPVGAVTDHAHQLWGLLYLELLEQHKLGIRLLGPGIDLDGIILCGNHTELHLLMLDCTVQRLPWRPLHPH